MKWLTDNEVLTPSRYFHSIGLLVEKKISPHAHWSYGAVDTLLSNRMYCGDMVQGKSKTISNVTKKLPKSEWTIVENTHEPIISRELWGQVQQIRDTSADPRKPMFTSPAANNVFSRKLFCGHCGFTMVRRRHSEQTYGYVCNTLRFYADGACGGAKISEVTLKKMVLNILLEQESNIAEILSSMSLGKQSGDTDNVELVSVRAELTKNKLYFKGLYESLVGGDITDVEYKEMRTAYEAKITVLAEREKQLCDDDRNRIRQENSLSKAQKNVRVMQNVSDLTAETVDKLVERIYVYEDKRIDVKFTFMDEILSDNGGADNE